MMHVDADRIPSQKRRRRWFHRDQHTGGLAPRTRHSGTVPATQPPFTLWRVNPHPTPPATRSRFSRACGSFYPFSDGQDDQARLRSRSHLLYGA